MALASEDLEDLESLIDFESVGQPTVSVYLDLTTAAKKKSAGEKFESLIRERMEQKGTNHSQRRKLQEDIDIVQNYLHNGCVPSGPGVVIFSCASSLFWRAYSLPVTVPDRVYIGPRFNLEPLRQALERMEHREKLLAEA